MHLPMIRFSLLPLLAIVASPATAMQDPPPATESPATQAADEDPAARFEEITDQYRAARNAWFERYQKASEEEQRTLGAEYASLADPYGEKLLALAQRHPGSSDIPPALNWILANVGNATIQARAVNLLLEGYDGDAQAMLETARSLAQSREPQRVEFLRTLLARPALNTESHHAARAVATYGLGSALRQSVESEKDPKRREELTNEALRLLEAATAFEDVELFPGYKTVASAASAELFEQRHLQVGMIAPDIEGEDIGGTTFKLSDYRGKVVLLDFWGNW